MSRRGRAARAAPEIFLDWPPAICPGDDCLWCHVQGVLWGRLDAFSARLLGQAFAPDAGFVPQLIPPHPDDLAAASVEVLVPDTTAEFTEPRKKQSYEEWHAETTALLAEQEARRE